MPAICGTHLGETKQPASTTVIPGIRQGFDQFHLYGFARHRLGFVRQPVARAYFNELHAPRMIYRCLRECPAYF